MYDVVQSLRCPPPAVSPTYIDSVHMYAWAAFCTYLRPVSGGPEPSWRLSDATLPVIIIKKRLGMSVYSLPRCSSFFPNLFWAPTNTERERGV